MNKSLLIYGAFGLAAVAGVYLYAKGNPTVITETSETPLFVNGTGAGVSGASINTASNGLTTTNTGISELTGLATLQSGNDLQAMLAQTAATKEVALAGIASDTQLGLAGKNLTFMQDFLGMVPDLKKLGISSIGGAGGLGGGIVYTDPKKNMSYATGLDANGNLIGQGPDGGNMLLMLSAQTAYDQSLVTQANGVIGTGSAIIPGTKPKPIRPVRINKNPNVITAQPAGA
jgi:hypothetical protein